MDIGKKNTKNNPSTKDLLVLPYLGTCWRNLRSPQGGGIPLLNSPLISSSVENHDIFEDLNNQERPCDFHETPLDPVLEPHFAIPPHSVSTS